MGDSSEEKEDSSFPLEETTFRRGFDVVDSELDLDVNLKERLIVGTATLHIKRSKPFVKILRLNFRQAEIKSVSANGVSTRYERLDFLRNIDCKGRRDAPMFYANYRTAIVAANRGELFVHLSDEQDESENIDLVVKYVLRDPRAGIRFSGSEMYTCDSPVVAGAVASGGSGCRCWFPCVDDPKSVCPYTVRVTVQRGMTVLCSGRLVEKKEDSMISTTTHTYKLTRPIPARTLGLAIGNFIMNSNNETGGQVRSYVASEASVLHPSSSSTTNLMKCTKNCDKMLEWIEQYLQYRYPFNESKGETTEVGGGGGGEEEEEEEEEEYTKVHHKQVFVHGLEIPDIRAVTPSHVLPVGGMFSGIKVFSTLVLLPVSLLHDSQRHLDLSDHTNLTQVYGLACQWFGCLVRAKTYADSWILESLSGHVLNHYVKSTKGGGAYMSRIDTINEMIVRCTLVSGRKGRSELSDLLSSSIKESSSSSSSIGGSSRRKSGMNATMLCKPLHPASVAVLSLCPNRMCFFFVF
jgi:aminopeptidase N